LFIDIFNKYKDKPEFKEVLHNMDKCISEKEFSGMNRLFIFQKESNDVVEVDDLYRVIFMRRLDPKFNKALFEGKSKKNWETIINVVQELNPKPISKNVSEKLVEKIKEEIASKKLVLESKSKRAAVLSEISAKNDSTSKQSFDSEAPGSQSIEAQGSADLESDVKSQIAQAQFDKKKATFLRDYNKFGAIFPLLNDLKKLKLTDKTKILENLIKVQSKFMVEFNEDVECLAAIVQINQSILKLQSDISQ
jgi:hypothetical protein